MYGQDQLASHDNSQ